MPHPRSTTRLIIGANRKNKPPFHHLSMPRFSILVAAIVKHNVHMVMIRITSMLNSFNVCVIKNMDLSLIHKPLFYEVEQMNTFTIPLHSVVINVPFKRTVQALIVYSIDITTASPWEARMVHYCIINESIASIKAKEPCYRLSKYLTSCLPSA